MRLWHSVLLACLFIPQWMGAPRAGEPDPAIPFTAEPVALFADAPARKRLGALVFRRGYRLVSADPEFGGFSSMMTDGHRFTLLGDGGFGIRFTLGDDGALRKRSAFKLPAGPGGGWHKRDRDSESMTIDPVTQRVWVAFETSNQIWRYAPDLARAESRAAPPAMAAWAENRGAEAMTRLPDGRFVLIDESEEWPGKPGFAGLIFAGDPTRAPKRATRFSYVAPENFKPTDMAALPDGRWIAINRRFGWRQGFEACVTVIDPAGLRPDGVLRGREIARFTAPALHDNFEGIAAVSDGQATHIWLISDNNQAWAWQRSLLLEFTLDEGRPGKGHPRPRPSSPR